MGKRIYKKLILTATAIIILLSAIGIIKQKTRSKETGFRLHITSNSKQKMNIPDPSTTNGIADITINPVKRLNFDENPKKTQLTDLSYLGLKEKAYVIRYAKGRYKNSKKDDYLALALATKKLGKAYFAILDYKNKKSYLIKTGQLADNVDQINKCDLTGTGKEEWIVSGVANKWIEWNAYQLSDGKIKEIPCNYMERAEGEKESINYVQDAFEVKYVAYDKVLVACKDADFKKVINVKDVDYLDHQIVQLLDGIEFEEDIEYDNFMNIDKKKGICYWLDLEVGHGTICAEIKAYLKYDKDADTIKVYKVDFKEGRW